MSDATSGERREAGEAERTQANPETAWVPNPDQQREYEEAISIAYSEYLPEYESLIRAKRRRITSRGVMIALAVVAVFLTAGGIAGPQIVYALEASRYSDLTEEVDAAATIVEDLEVQIEAEALMYELRSTEVSNVPNQLLNLSGREGDALGKAFKTQAAASAKELSEALVVPPVGTDPRLPLKTKAQSARELEKPDPKSWFDVDRHQVIEFAAIETARVNRAQTQGTVTLERVKEARELATAHAARGEELEGELEVEVEKNEVLQRVVNRVASEVRSESERVVQAAATMIADREAERVEFGLSPTPTETAFEASVETLQKALQATTFVVNAKDQVVGLPSGSDLPEGAMVIPGGDAIRLAYILPKLSAFADAYAADGEAARIAAEEEAARIAAEEEAARIAAEEEAARIAAEQQRIAEEEAAAEADGSGEAGGGDTPADDAGGGAETGGGGAELVPPAPVE